MTMRIQIVLAAVLLWQLSGGRLNASDLVLTGARIYPSPTAPLIENGTILVHDGRILAVGPNTAEVKVPRDATVIDCKNLIVTTGFWNSHIHILTPGLLHANKLTPNQITAQLEQMLTRWGFTTVFDIASVLENTLLIRRRIESGEVRGPRIFTVGEPFWDKGGTPVYIRGFLESNHIRMPEIESTAQAVDRARQQIRDGADGIKIFTGSIEADGVLVMPVELAKAIVAEAHRSAKPVFAHPSNIAGIQVAFESGVDILAHPPSEGTGWTPALVESLTSAHMALIPTLTLFRFEGKKAGISEAQIENWTGMTGQEVKTFFTAGGQILFGTDVGYIDQFDTSEEFTLMGRAGLSFRDILASLTTNPAKRFGYSARSGNIAPGMDGDLVVLEGDPASDLTAFSKVRYTIRGGKIIYSK